MKFYSTKAAARCLGFTEHTLKYHVCQGHIEYRKVGHSLVFTQVQLDKFESTRRPHYNHRKRMEVVK